MKSFQTEAANEEAIENNPNTANTELSGKEYGEFLTKPTVNAARVISLLKGKSGPSLSDILPALYTRSDKILAGDTAYVEAMLLNQAVTLDTLFYASIVKAENAEHLKQAQVYSDIALRAQKQSRATLQALVDIKNPRQVAFVKNVNAAVNQQINHGLPIETGNLEKIISNKLLTEKDCHASLDTRRTKTASKINSKLEAMGKGRSENTGG